EHVRAREGGQLRPGQLHVSAVDDRQHPLGRHQRSDARQRRLEERAVPHDPAVLLGNWCAGYQPGEGLEAGTIPTGQHQGPEALRRRLHFPLRCAEPCGRFAWRVPAGHDGVAPPQRRVALEQRRRQRVRSFRRSRASGTGSARRGFATHSPRRETRMKLWSGVLSPFSAKVRIALAEKKLGYETLVVPWSRKTLWGPKPPEFLAVSRHGQVPVLIDGEVAVFDSTVSCEYLEDRYPKPPLRPAGPGARLGGSCARASHRGARVRGDDARGGRRVAGGPPSLRRFAFASPLGHH